LVFYQLFFFDNSKFETNYEHFQIVLNILHTRFKIKIKYRKNINTNIIVSYNGVEQNETNVIAHASIALGTFSSIFFLS